MEQVTLRWYDAPYSYSVLRDPSKEFDDDNYYASVNYYCWEVWGDWDGGDRSVIAGVKIRNARGESGRIEDSKLTASQEIVRQLQTAGVKAVIRRVAK